jgi:glycosyltransferase domain-containing protein
MKKLSILVPTYNRPEKLRRFLSYINSCTSAQIIPSFIEILIGDGSTPEMQADTHQETKKFLYNNDSVTHYGLPNETFESRMIFLLKRSSAPYILVIGDDDLPIFDAIESLIVEFEKDILISAVAGRFLNVTEFTATKLMLSVAERPYSGFSLTSTPLSRVISYASLNGLGITSLSYAMQRREHALKFFQLIKDKDFYFGGIEFFHQLFTCVTGHVIFVNHPLVLRDFTYIGYQRYKKREAPVTDAVPYAGLAAIEFAALFLAEEVDINASDAFAIVLSLFKLPEQLSTSKFIVQENLKYLQVPSLNHLTLKIATAAWLETYKQCYPEYSPRKEKIKHRIHQILPSRLKTLLKVLWNLHKKF